MIDSWTPMVERIAFSTFKRGKRVIAITSPQGASGVSTLCEQLAGLSSLMGAKTLLVDLTGSAEDAVPDSYWQPCFGNAGQAIANDPAGYDRLKARFIATDRFRYSNADLLRQAFTDDLCAYEAIVVDASPVPTLASERINGAAAAAACDTTLLLCMSGRTSRSELAACQDALANAQANILGVVLNEMQNPTLGAELARESRRLHRLLPGFARWLERKALQSKFLN